ncbi:MAG: class I SAM-dependent methyltransferase, partial [Nitrospiria bacterium]
LQGWTWNLAESVRSFGLIDVLFIDSWHDYEHAMRDWDAYRPLLSTTALVICDDITTDRGPVIDRMDQFWNELLGQKFLSKKVHEQYPMGFLKWILS